MKKLTFGSILVIVALLLSSCQLHTGLGSLLSGNKPSTNATPGKHVKATHTPPSPKTPTATPVSSNDAVSITGAGFQSNALAVKVGTAVSWAGMFRDHSTSDPSMTGTILVTQ